MCDDNQALKNIYWTPLKIISGGSFKDNQLKIIKLCHFIDQGYKNGAKFPDDSSNKLLFKLEK